MASSRLPAAVTGAAVALLTLLAVATVSTGTAAAHAALVRSDPADGSTVAVAPSAVTLTFDEKMAAPAVVVVTDAKGRRVDLGAVRVAGDEVSVPVAVRVPGRFTVAFRVVSADGHPVSDQLTFAFVPPGATAPPPAAAGSGGSAATDRADHTSLVRSVGVIGLGLLLTLVLGIGLVRALRANQQAPDIAARRAAERASTAPTDRS